MTTLTQSQRTLIAMSLRIAAKQFTQDAKDTRGQEAFPNNQGLKSLGEQFDQQAMQADTLADMYDNASAATVTD